MRSVPQAAAGSALALALCTLAGVPCARAQSGSQTPATSVAPAATPQFVPPKLVQFVPATTPELATETARDVGVGLELTVGADGRPKDVRLTAGAGEPFDSAAQAAVAQFRFEPARVAGKAVAARIRYRYVFELRPVQPTGSPAPGATAQAARLESASLLRGTVHDTSGSPLVGASLVLKSGELRQQGATDEAGTFVFELAPGEYRLRIEAEGFEPLEITEDVGEGQSVEVGYHLRPERDPQAFEAVARVDPPPREPTRRVVRREQLTRIAGTRGDAIRAIEILPGMGRPPGLVGFLLVRGSSPQDSIAMLDGLPVELLYHFGGLTSFINSFLLERIELYPGNFSARYGRFRGGMVEVVSREPSHEGFKGVVDLNLFDSSVLFEGPLGSDVSAAVAYRRSYVDFFFENLIGDAFGVLAAPVYQDYQAFVSARPSSADKLSFKLYGSDDRFQLIVPKALGDEASLRGNFELRTSFHRAHVSWRRALSEHVDQDVQVATGTVAFKLNLGPVAMDLTYVPVFSRAEWRARLSSNVRLIAGFDLHAFDGDIEFELPMLPTDGAGNPSIGNSAEWAKSRYHFTLVRPALYVESDLLLTEAFRIVLGSRLDYYSEVDGWSYDPRLSVHYTLVEGTVLKGGVGMYAQPPQFLESNPEAGNPSLRPTRTLHTSAGLDHKFNQALSVGAEGYFKYLSDRVVAALPPLQYENDGIGRIYGLELSAKMEPRGRLFGYFSYTSSRSERKDRNGPWRLFDWDQTHILTLATTYRLGRGWEFQGTFRYVSGNPETPIIGSIQDPIEGGYEPIDGAINSLRLPAFNRLDLRLLKQWRFKHWRLSGYLDIINTYNASNSEGRSYSYDFRHSTLINGIPLLPNLGVRGQW